MIIFTHHTAESHGILGAQVAATFFQRELAIPSIVVGIERDFEKDALLRFINEFYTGQDRFAAFSHLCGRTDLLDLARELRRQGFVTLLGGPQARQDHQGEPDTSSFPHRFRGLKSIMDLAFQGPVEGLRWDHLDARGECFDYPWTKRPFLGINWSNLYTFGTTLQKIDVRLGQVLQTVGCPYAVTWRSVTLPPPGDLRARGVQDLTVQSRGCIFCDVSRDKGYEGSLDSAEIVAQIAALPEIDGRKIPFELINEYPVRSLGKLIEDAARHKVRLSQIHLVCRVDDITTHRSELEAALSMARAQDIRIMFASIGFESFCDRLLHCFCKGITVDDIVRCVAILRRLKDRFKEHLFYRRDEGAHHGFIRPTPWDDGETLQETDRNIFLHRLFEDILPEHSTPLIIHHASYLGDWIRTIESETGITFPRTGTWIQWWNPSQGVHSYEQD